MLRSVLASDVLAKMSSLQQYLFCEAFGKVSQYQVGGEANPLAAWSEDRGVPRSAARLRS